jgi:hypothetical protein
MQSDHERRQLFVALEESLGRGPAGTLMELLPPIGWADVARQSDLVGIRGEMAQLRGEFAELRGEVAEFRGEVAELRGELKAEIAELRGEVRAQLPRLVAANIGSMMGIAGLVFAVAKLG